jgi:deoxyribose-phosphate aldolase
VFNEIKEIKKICSKVVLKVIIETSLLKTKENVMVATILSVLSKADYVKTSTGFYGGADKELTKVMMESVNGYALIKASGGIKDKNDCVDYINMGVNRIGTSSGVLLVKNEKIEKGY